MTADSTSFPGDKRTSTSLLEPSEPGRHRAERASGHGSDSPASGSGLPLLSILGVTLGVIATASAYAAGRLDWPGSTPLFWVGQLLTVVPIASRLLLRRVTNRQATSLVLALAIATYLLKICYSPDRFRFPDELQHLRTLADLLATGGLHTPNPALPISTSYPGLELATASVVQLLDVSPFVAGLVVIGVAHVLAALSLYLVFRTVTKSNRLGGLAVVAYATNPHYDNFDAMFVYQALALSFLALCLFAAIRLTAAHSPRGAIPWFLLGAASAAAAVATHHVTSYVLVGLLVLLTVQRTFARDWGAARRLGGLTFLGLALIGAWFIFEAPETVQYFGPTVSHLAQDAAGLVHRGPSQKTVDQVPQTGSTADRYLAYASTAATLAAMLVGVYSLWRRRQRQTWVAAMAIGALTYAVAVGVRLFSSDGAELYGRALSFVAIPLAVALTETLRILTARVRIRRRLIALGLVTLILVGGVVTGWPPSWERIPGRPLIEGFESSVEPVSLSVSAWARSHLPADSRIATDLTDYALLGTLGRQEPVRAAAPLFYSTGFEPADRDLVRAQDIRYVVVDLRTAAQLPASGSYFPVDPRAYRYKRPLSERALTKFEHVPGVSRIYDNGDVVIYDLQGSDYDR